MFVAVCVSKNKADADFAAAATADPLFRDRGSLLFFSAGARHVERRQTDND